MCVYVCVCVWVLVVGTRAATRRANLLDGDGGAPAPFLVQNREAHRTGRVHIGMEEGRRELACMDQDREGKVCT
jgi:hypothetical protein